MLGPAVGPLLGGFITTYLHWRLIFFINIPIGIARHLSDQPLHRELARGASGPARLVRLLSLGERRRAALARALAGRRRADSEQRRGRDVRGRRGDGRALLAALASAPSCPLLDLRFFRVPTFQASVLGGSLFRIGLGAVPFLLPLALQEGLRHDARSSPARSRARRRSAACSCARSRRACCIASASGTTLMVNAALSGLAIAACGMFFPGTPTWVIWAVVLLGGFFPALQFTSLNSLAYAEIETRDVGRATSLASFVQQMSLGLGVTIAGITLRDLAERARSSRRSSGRISGRRLLWSGVFSFLSIPVTARLSREAGSEISRGTRG